MRSVLWWIVAGVVVPPALAFVPSTIMLAVAGEPLQLPTALAWLPLVVLMLGLPGALGGLVVGILDHRLERYVRNGSPATRRRRSVVAAMGLFALLTAATVGLLAYTGTDMTGAGMTDAVINLAFCAVVAAVPGVIAYVRYARIARTSAAPAAPAELPAG